MSLDFDPKLKGGRGFTAATLLVVAALLGLLAWAGAAYARGAAPAAPPAPGAGPLSISSSAAVPTTAPAHATEILAAPTDTTIPAAFPLVQTTNGLTITLRQVQRTGDTLLADVCYPQLHGDQSWMLSLHHGDVRVQAGVNTIAMAGGDLLETQQSATGEAIGRCDQIHFTVPAALDLTGLTLTIQRLVTSPSESPDCNAAQDRLNRAGTGLVIACHPGDYTFSWEVVTRPVTLTADAANNLVRDSFSDIVSGPWVFRLSLPPAAGASAPTPSGPTASATAADPRAYSTHPDTVSFARMDDLTGAASYVILPLDCLARPGGCSKPPAPTIPLPPTNVLGAAAWAPDGSAFAFLAGVDGRFDIYRVAADGSGLADLTPSAGVRNSVAWSPDGQWLLWGQAGGSADEIWLMRPDGSGARKLAEGGNAAWAPDGAHIVYSVQTGDPSDAANVRSDFYQIDITASGAPPVRLTDTPHLKNDPRFSPDGRALAFTAQVAGHWSLYVLNLDEAALPLSGLDAPGARRLSPAGMEADGPAWSPSGLQLAYVGNASAVALPAIYVTDVDGSSQLQVSATNRFPDSSPAWAPDGSRLAYVAEDGGHFNISLVNNDGTNLIQLTADQPGATTTLEYQEPSWRP